MGQKPEDGFNEARAHIEEEWANAKRDSTETDHLSGVRLALLECYELARCAGSMEVMSSIPYTDTTSDLYWAGRVVSYLEQHICDVHNFLARHKWD